MTTPVTSSNVTTPQLQFQARGEATTTPVDPSAGRLPVGDDESSPIVRKDTFTPTTSTERAAKARADVQRREPEERSEEESNDEEREASTSERAATAAGSIGVGTPAMIDLRSPSEGGTSVIEFGSDGPVFYNAFIFPTSRVEQADAVSAEDGAEASGSTAAYGRGSSPPAGSRFSALG